ncbi:hypothetical protein POM88_016694 [Heracleum sosnowskyi]|uniref:Anaphase-promoting complex subunit 4-like WD40 domain-containing protein n=1 Tax=Heracleum sosnowskyi TaxID=360622 RepID=A0AAD8MX69_9APIA|nr:hypothetical protein POM88_016694 [Heracleum sosnowskyi]
MRDHGVEMYRGHNQEVCGLGWSPLGQQSAIRGKYNLVHIWDMTSNSPTQWLHRLQDHTTVDKALAWCPFQKNLLVSGGGSQVCSLLWNRNERELLSSHGFPHNQLILGKYPPIVKVAERLANSSYVRATRSTIPPSQDGFIPIRPREMDFVFANKIDNDVNPYMLSSSSNSSSEAYRNHIAQVLNINTTRIFSFRNNSSIHVSIDHFVPEAPRHWGSKNVLAIALDDKVHLCDASNNIVYQLAKLDEQTDLVMSVKWAPNGRRVAIGLYNSDVQLWDSVANKPIVNNDVRIRDHGIEMYRGHN